MSDDLLEGEPEEEQAPQFDHFRLQMIILIALIVLKVAAQQH